METTLVMFKRFKGPINSQQKCKSSVISTVEFRCDSSLLTKKFPFSDPEDSIDLSYKIDEGEQTVDVVCAVHNIFPLPDVKFM